MVRSSGESTTQEGKRYKGVRMRSWGKWVTEIRLKNTRARLWLGSYATPEQAAKAYDVALLCLRGSSASLNFPDSPPQFAPLGLSHREIQELAAKAGGSAPFDSIDASLSGGSAPPSDDDFSNSASPGDEASSSAPPSDNCSNSASLDPLLCSSSAPFSSQNHPSADEASSSLPSHNSSNNNSSQQAPDLSNDTLECSTASANLSFHLPDFEMLSPFDQLPCVSQWDEITIYGPIAPIDDKLRDLSFESWLWDL